MMAEADRHAEEKHVHCVRFVAEEEEGTDGRHDFRRFRDFVDEKD